MLAVVLEEFSSLFPASWRVLLMLRCMQDDKNCIEDKEKASLL